MDKTPLVLICCGFVVYRPVRQIHNKSKRVDYKPSAREPSNVSSANSVRSTALLQSRQNYVSPIPIRHANTALAAAKIQPDIAASLSAQYRGMKKLRPTDAPNVDPDEISRLVRVENL